MRLLLLFLLLSFFPFLFLLFYLFVFDVTCCLIADRHRLHLGRLRSPRSKQPTIPPRPSWRWHRTHSEATPHRTTLVATGISKSPQIRNLEFLHASHHNGRLLIDPQRWAAKQRIHQLYGTLSTGATVLIFRLVFGWGMGCTIARESPKANASSKATQFSTGSAESSFATSSETH